MHGSLVCSSSSFDKCVQPCSYLPNQDMECLSPESLSASFPSSLTHPPRVNSVLNSTALDYVGLFSRCVLLWVWLLLHNIMSLKSIGVACVRSVFPSVA